MAIEQYKVTVLRQLQLLFPSIIINCITVIIYIYVIGLSAPMYIAIVFFAFFFVVNLLPVVILHLQYLSVNKSSVLLCNNVEGTLEYIRKDLNYKAGFSEIESFHYYSSYGKGSWYTFGEYGFCKIVFSNKEEMIVTCLMMKNVKEKMEEILCLKAEEHLKFLALLPKHKRR